MVGFKVCNLETPLGIDVNPTFSWIVDTFHDDTVQQSYRILVSTTDKLIQDGIADMWDSGNVFSQETIDIPYKGMLLQSKTTYYWAVQAVYGDKPVRSSVQKFTTGILRDSEWQGLWIGKLQPERPCITLSGTGWIWCDKNPDASQRNPVLFSKNFFVPEDKQESKKLRSAYVAFTATDAAVLSVNDAEQCFLTSRYGGKIMDVTGCIQKGENTVSVLVTPPNHGFCGFAGKICLIFKDGSILQWVTDNDWQAVQYVPGQDAGQQSAAKQICQFQEASFDTEKIDLLYSDERAAIFLRKEFEIKKAVRHAHAYICGLGFFELSINGTLADESVLNPYPTQYNKRILYRTFDVANMLTPGTNAVGVVLGNSYYNEIGGVWNWETANWRDAPKLMFHLSIVYTDGTYETLVSDTDWKCTADGPIIANSMYYGDVYDARKEKENWNKAGFRDGDWESAVPVTPPAGIRSSHMKAPLKRIADIEISEIKMLPGGTQIITLKEMTSGWIRLMNLQEAAGAHVSILYGQILNEDGTVRKYGGADGEIRDWWRHAYLQQDIYICKGTEGESYEPKFSYKGFLHVQIEGCTRLLNPSDIQVYRISNAVDEIAVFDSSDAYLNRLHSMMHRAMANNHLGDHCDPVLEKNGWTGDANVSLSCLMYNYDMSGSLPGWLQVMEDCFDQYGTVPVMVPTADWNIDNSPVWNTLFLNGVEALSNYFGMGEYEKEKYCIMRKYACLQMKTLQENGWVWQDDQLGDWVAPIGGENPFVQYNEQISEGSGITATAFLYGIFAYMERLAGKLEKPAHAAEYAACRKKIYTAFQETFFDAERNCYQTRTWNQIGTRTRYRQTDNLTALVFDLVPFTHRQAVVENLVKDIQQKNHHLDTGCVGTRYLLPVLCDFGFEEIAYKILMQTSYPSWGYWAENGATSTWEMWEATSRSFDHYFLGTYDEWFYTHLCGIRDVSQGYKQLSIKPVFLQKLSRAAACIHTVRGKLSVSWHREDRKIRLSISLPFGSKAVLQLPKNMKGIQKKGKSTNEGELLILGQGEHIFLCSDER